MCLLSHLVLSDSVILWTAAHQDPLPWRFPSETTGMGCYALLQGIFPTQGSNLHLLRLLHCKCVLYLAEPLGIHSKATYMPFESLFIFADPWIHQIPCGPYFTALVVEELLCCFRSLSARVVPYVAVVGRDRVGMWVPCPPTPPSWSCPLITFFLIKRFSPLKHLHRLVLYFLWYKFIDF